MSFSTMPTGMRIVLYVPEKFINRCSGGRKTCARQFLHCTRFADFDLTIDVFNNMPVLKAGKCFADRCSLYAELLREDLVGKRKG